MNRAYGNPAYVSGSDGNATRQGLTVAEISHASRAKENR
jgi:hypothetical protein